MKVRQYLTEKWTDAEFIIDQLANDENSSDEEMIDHLSKETKVKKEKISKLIKSERSKFLKDTMMSKIAAMKIVKKYI
jgi:vacuolar-type H+-ATPase subunit H